MKSASVALIKKNSGAPSYILTSGELHVAQLGNFILIIIIIIMYTYIALFC